MNFYNALQMDPSILKNKILQCETRHEKSFYWSAMIVRSILLVSFAILFISILSNWFGQENTPLAVVLFCIMLGIRFVNFEYCIEDSLLTLAIALGILLFIPSIVTVLPPLFMILIHFIFFFVLLYMTTQRPEMGNGGLYSFAYVYLSGNPVYGESLGKRALMALLGYLICGTILFIKHRHKHSNIRFKNIILKFNLHNIIYLWQLRMAIGVSLVLTAGQYFGIKRFMWMGFACASLLSQYPYDSNTASRFSQRIVGVLVGSGLFFIIFQITPDFFHPLMGPLGGLCLGFCTDYRYKTALNCFGALMVGVGIYGIKEAVILRITDTILGVLFGMIFAAIFHKLLAKRVLDKELIYSNKLAEE